MTLNSGKKFVGGEVGEGRGLIDTQLRKESCRWVGRGGSIDTQLGKSLCIFAGITFDNVDLGGGGSIAASGDKCPISTDNKFLHFFEHISPPFAISTNTKKI